MWTNQGSPLRITALAQSQLSCFPSYVPSVSSHRGQGKAADWVLSWAKGQHSEHRLLGAPASSSISAPLYSLLATLSSLNFTVWNQIPIPSWWFYGGNPHETSRTVSAHTQQPLSTVGLMTTVLYHIVAHKRDLILNPSYRINGDRRPIFPHGKLKQKLLSSSGAVLSLWVELT